jgi:hypothetical protein
LIAGSMKHCQKRLSIEDFHLLTRCRLTVARR